MIAEKAEKPTHADAPRKPGDGDCLQFDAMLSKLLEDKSNG
jgi:hypothetical protein